MTVVASEGKTLRGSKHNADGHGALHLVSAWAHEGGLVLAQRAVDGKSNEITAIPELICLLELEGAIVTIDAIETQKHIAAQIVVEKADYVLALKCNQGTFAEDAVLIFADPVLAKECPAHEEIDSGHLDEPFRLAYPSHRRNNTKRSIYMKPDNFTRSLHCVPIMLSRMIARA